VTVELVVVTVVLGDGLGVMWRSWCQEAVRCVISTSPKSTMKLILWLPWKTNPPHLWH